MEHAGTHTAGDTLTAFDFAMEEVIAASTKLARELESGHGPDSFDATIYKALAERDQAPPEKKEWLEMVAGVVAKTGFPAGLDRAGLIDAFSAHNEAVRSAVPASQLLVYQVKDGWKPLCGFLGTPVPSEPFPRTNDRSEFWDRVTGKI